MKDGLPAIHPGEFLAEILGELGFLRRNSRARSAYRRCAFPTSSAAPGR